MSISISFETKTRKPSQVQTTNSCERKLVLAHAKVFW